MSRQSEDLLCQPYLCCAYRQRMQQTKSFFTIVDGKHTALQDVPGSGKKGREIMKFSTKTLSVLLALFSVLSLLAGMIACSEEDSAKGGKETPATVTFTLIVVHADGTEKSFEVTTDQETVGAALLAEGIISGEDGDFGLYVKVVDGETADYDVNQSYWSFYIGEEYALTGIDQTPVTDGGVYSLRYTQ